MKDEAPSNLRLLPVAEPEDDPFLTKKEPAEAHCRHQHGTIDEAAHRLYCRDCGDEIDALDFLLALVDKWDWVRRERKAAGAKARLAANELADVERRLKNAKARLRKEGVLLTTAEANAARDQLRALSRTLPNLLRDVLGEDFSEARRKAEQTAKLCGYRQEDAQKAVAALDRGLDEVGVRRRL